MKKKKQYKKSNNMNLSDAILLLQNNHDWFLVETVDNPPDGDQFWVKTQQAHSDKPETDSVTESMTLIFEATTNGTLHT